MTEHAKRPHEHTKRLAEWYIGVGKGMSWCFTPEKVVSLIAEIYDLSDNLSSVRAELTQLRTRHATGAFTMKESELGMYWRREADKLQGQPASAQDELDRLRVAYSETSSKLEAINEYASAFAATQAAQIEGLRAENERMKAALVNIKVMASEGHSPAGLLVFKRDVLAEAVRGLGGGDGQ